MNVHGKPTRTIWLHPQNPAVVQIIDQRALPHEWVIEDLSTVEQVSTAIRDMHVRGAGLIGATAGFGMYLAAREAAGNAADFFQEAGNRLKATRPTAVNLAWAVDRQLSAVAAASGPAEMAAIALSTARSIADEDAEACRRIGEHGGLGFEVAYHVAHRQLF